MAADMSLLLSQVDSLMDALWENGTLDQKRLDEISNMHLHTDL